MTEMDEFTGSPLGSIEILTDRMGGPVRSAAESVRHEVYEAYRDVSIGSKRDVSHYLARLDGVYGVASDICFAEDDGFPYVECLCFPAALKATHVVAARLAVEHPGVSLAAYEHYHEKEGRPIAGGIMMFTPWDMPVEDYRRLETALDGCWGRVASASYEKACWPENLRAYGGRSAAFRAVTDSTGRMLDGSDPAELGVVGRKAYGQVPFMQMGPTSVLARTPSGAYGTMSEIYMEPGPSGAFAYLDRFDDYQAFLEDGQEALRRCAARLAWRHRLPGVAVSVVEDDERGKPGTTALQVFVNAELPEERRREVLEDLDAQFREIEAETGRIEREHGEDELGDAGLPERQAPEKSRACFGEEH